jgi:sugar phosphate isomerase/epimerase
MFLAAGGESFPLLPQKVSIDLISELGLEGYDLILRGGKSLGVQLDDVRSDIPGWAGRFGERVRGSGLEFADIFCVPGNSLEPMAINHPDPRQREDAWALFDDMLELAARIGAPGLTMLPGVDWPGEDHEESLARAAHELQQRAEAARARSTRFSVEPHIGSVCPAPSDVARLCELAPDLELALNYTHYTVQGFSDAEIEPLLARARHYKARGSRKGRMQAPLKENSIDFERVIDAMNESDYDGYITLDYVWVDSDGLNDIDVVSEMVLLRDRLRAKIAGKPWSYPTLAEMDFSTPGDDGK